MAVPAANLATTEIDIIIPNQELFPFEHSRRSIRLEILQHNLGQIAIVLAGFNRLPLDISKARMSTDGSPRRSLSAYAIEELVKEVSG